MPPRRYAQWHVANARTALTFPAGNPAVDSWLNQQRGGLWVILADPVTPFEGSAYAERVLRDAAFCAVRIPSGKGSEDKARAFKPAAHGLIETGSHIYLLWRIASQSGRTALDAAKKAANMAAEQLGGENAGYKIPLPGTTHDGAMARMLLANPTGQSTLTSFEPRQSEEAVASLGQIKTEDTKWVWPGVFPAGFALMVGAAGLRKTQAAISAGACIATGGYWPASQTRAAPGCVMIFASEDHIASVIKNRTVAAVSMFVDDMIARGDTRPGDRQKSIDQAVDRFFATNEVPRLPSEQHKIERWAAAMTKKHGLPVKMSIFDPIAHFYEKQSTEGVREALDPLKDWAVAQGGVAIGIRHPKKGGGETIQDLVSGSMAEMQTVRAAYCFFPTLDGQNNEAWMLWSKGNYHAPADKLGFETTVEDWTTPEGFRTSRVRWHDRRIPLTADEYLDGQTPRLPPPGGGRNGNGGGPRLLLGSPDAELTNEGKVDAEQWVRDILQGGAEITPAALRKLAAKEGISRQAIWRLRQKGILDGQDRWSLRT